MCHDTREKSGSRSRERSHTSVLGVGVIVCRADAYLLGLRKSLHGYNTWGFPGGRIELGESPLDAAARELMEETKLELYNARPAGWGTGWIQYAHTRHITLFVEGCVRGDPQLAEPEKFWEWAWFQRGELPTELFEPTQGYFKDEIFTAAHGIHAGFL